MAFSDAFLVPVGPLRRTLPVTGASVLPAFLTPSVSVFAEPVPETFAAPSLRL